MLAWSCLSVRVWHLCAAALFPARLLGRFLEIMEAALRDAVLPVVVSGVHIERSGWDDLSPRQENVLAPTTLADFHAISETCRMWKEELERTVEGAAHRLARWEASLAPEPHWCSVEEVIGPLFKRNFEAFSNSWVLSTPLANWQWHLSPLEEMSELQVADLRDALIGFGNRIMDVPVGSTVSASSTVWVSPNHRSTRW